MELVGHPHPNFARLIDLREAYGFYDGNPDFHIHQLAKMVEEEMIKIERFADEYLSLEFEDIRIQFSQMARKYEATEEEFENLMERLYIWGDQRLQDGSRTCWVRII